MPISRIATPAPNGHISRVVSAVAKNLNADGSLNIGGGGGTRIRSVTATEADFNKGSYQDTVLLGGVLRLVATVTSPTNVALGKSVTYSSNAEADAEVEPFHLDPNVLTNGSTSTNDYFAALSSDGNPVYVQVDLGDVFLLSQIKVWHYYSDGRTYYGTKVEVSEDGVTWITVFDSAVSGTYPETGAGKTIDFSPTRVRYIRDWLHGNTTNLANHWCEIQAFEGGYVASGVYESPIIDLFSVGQVQSSRIELDAEIPEGTTVKIETRLSTDGGRTWGSWKETLPGQAIPDLPAGTNVLFGRLQYRLVLTCTGDTTPIVKSIAVDVMGSGSVAALQSAFGQAELALLKTNFHFDSISTASRYSLSDMTVDLLNDQSGIDQEQSDCFWDPASRSLRAKQVQISSGKSYSVAPAPSSNYPDSGDKELTDGVIGSDSFANPAYVGWSAASPITITIDLDEATPVAACRVHCASGDGGLRWPDLIKMSVSPDGVNWTEVGVADFSHLVDSTTGHNTEWLMVTATMSLPNTRHVRLQLTKGGEWLFISEVEVYTFGVGAAISKAQDLPKVPARILLSAEERLNSGRITYYVSRDDGATWMRVLKDQVAELQELPMGTILRVKAVIEGDAELLAWGWAWNSDDESSSGSSTPSLLDMQLNILKTNFRVAAAGTASLYEMDNLFVDLLENTDGLDLTKSSGYRMISGRIIRADENKGSMRFTRTSNSHINLGHSTEQKPPNAVTLEAWAYMDDWSKNYDSRIISSTNSGGWNLGLNMDGYGRAASIYRNGGYAHLVYNLSTLSPGWHHFALTYDGRVATFYLDGEPKASNDAGKDYPIGYDNDNAIIIGGEAGTGATADTGRGWDGFIDEVRIWSVARTQEEIQRGMFVRLAGNEPGLVGYYRFEEEETVATDLSPSQRHGTILNGATWSAEVPFDGGEKAVIVSKPRTLEFVPSQVLISAEENLRSGSITYFVSRDGGKTWTEAVKDKATDISSQPPGTRLVVKAEIAGDAELLAWGWAWDNGSPKIIGGVPVGGTSDKAILDLQVNLLKTNFKVDSLSNAARNSMANMIVDAFNDQSGIDADRSQNYTWDDTLKAFRPAQGDTDAVLVSEPISLDVPPTTALVLWEEDRSEGASVEVYVSRDNGITWAFAPNGHRVDLRFQPAGSTLRLMCKISGDAALLAWGCAWS